MGSGGAQSQVPPIRQRKSSVFFTIAEEDGSSSQDTTKQRVRMNSVTAVQKSGAGSSYNSNNLVKLSSAVDLVSIAVDDSQVMAADEQQNVTINLVDELDAYDRTVAENYPQIPSSPSSNSIKDNESSSLGLVEHGVSGVVVFMSPDSKLFVANCGDAMVVLSRAGVAVPLTMRHALYPNNQAISHPPPPATNTNSKSPPQATLAESTRRATDQEPNARRTQQQQQPNKQELLQSNMAKKEILRIRQNCGVITGDGLIGPQQMALTRSFGFFNSLPYINASPYLSITDCCDQCEFLIIASSSFWSVMNYQTAVEIAKQRADDAMEAAMVLRDFAEAYSAQAIYSVDDDSERGIEKRRCQRSRAAVGVVDSYHTTANEVRYRPRDSFTVLVINLRDWMSGVQNKGAVGNLGGPMPTGPAHRRPFNKVRRRKDDAVDSTIANLAPEIEPPTGNVALVFTDVRNSTQLWERRPIAMRVAIREHNQIMRRNLRLCNGYEVKTEGDAFMVAFKNIVDALRWCLNVQIQLLEADWPQEILEAPEGILVYGPKSLGNDNAESDNEDKVLLYRGLSVRMGIHVGNPVCELDPITRRMDYFGPMVNKTARVSGSADGGQLYVSSDVEQTYQCLRSGNCSGDKMPSYSAKEKAALAERFKLLQQQLDPVFVNIGERKLKGLDNPETLFSVMPQALVGRHKIPPPALPGEKSHQSAAMPAAESPEKRDLDTKISISTSSVSASTVDQQVMHSRQTSQNNGRRMSIGGTSSTGLKNQSYLPDEMDGQPETGKAGDLDVLLLRLQSASLKLLESRLLRSDAVPSQQLSNSSPLETNDFEVMAKKLTSTDGVLEKLIYRLELIASTLATAIQPNRLDSIISENTESAKDTLNTFRLLLGIAKDRLSVNNNSVINK
jgi:class 3 adenylate cyclase/serine/threonine protein phosphatase PrpC